MGYGTKGEAKARMLRGAFGKGWRWALLLLAVSPVLAAAGCNLFNDLGDAWANADATGAGGGNMCGAMGGAGGAGGDDDGDGGGDQGAGGDGSGVGVGSGVGGDSSAASAGAGAGDGDGAWSNGGVGHVARAPRHRGRRGGIGRAGQADCPGMTPPPADPALMWPFPPIPKLAPLTTTRLRAICTAQGIGAGMTGILFNRACGLEFENWVLFTLGKLPRWTTPIPSPARKSKNSGLPASVIPEQVTDLLLLSTSTGITPFELSQFWEVKAVTGFLYPSSSQYQMLGLIDVASLSPAGLSTLAKHPPPVLLLTTTGNTFLSPSLLATATAYGVAIWLQVVFVDATIPNDPNPDLYIGPLVPMNTDIYETTLPLPSQPSGVGSPLTSPTTPPTPVPGDPDPPEVD